MAATEIHGGMIIAGMMSMEGILIMPHPGIQLPSADREKQIVKNNREILGINSK